MKGFNQDTHIDFIIEDLRAGTMKAALDAMLKQAEAFTEFKKPDDAYIRLLEKAPANYGTVIPCLKSGTIEKPVTILARLHTPVEVQNVGRTEMVDVVCLLISPRNDGPVHLRRLSRLSRVFLNEEMHTKIREAQDQDALRMIVNKTDGWLIAA